MKENRNLQKLIHAAITFSVHLQVTHTQKIDKSTNKNKNKNRFIVTINNWKVKVQKKRVTITKKLITEKRVTNEQNKHLNIPKSH